MFFPHVYRFLADNTIIFFRGALPGVWDGAVLGGIATVTVLAGLSAFSFVDKWIRRDRSGDFAVGIALYLYGPIALATLVITMAVSYGADAVLAANLSPIHHSLVRWALGLPVAVWLMKRAIR